MGCEKKHPLVRDGVSQKQRLAPELKPSYAKVDERSLEDLLYFLVNYAKEVTYFDIDNKLTGDWQLFLEKDITVIIALIAKKDAVVEKDLFIQLKNTISLASSSELEVKKNFKTMFDLLFTTIWEFNKWYQQTDEGLGIQALLKRYIRSQVKAVLEPLIAWYKGALNTPKLFNTNYTPTIDQTTYELKDAKNILEKGLLDVWYTSDVEGAGFTDWDSYYVSITPDNSIYGNSANPAPVRIKKGMEQFEILFDDLYNALVQVIDKASHYVQETLAKYAGHEPHMGLILSFLQLFKHGQDHINTITKRHLDFYYEKVLQLARLDAVPDKAHLIFELAKHIESHKVEKGILLKAGKDALGNEVVYETTKENIYNKAGIEYMKSLFIDKDDKWQVYASPVANSADGKGGEFEEENGKWKAFGEAQQDFTSTERTMPDADIGFAITSPNLLLQEGIRIIILGIECDGAIPAGQVDMSEMANLSLTGEKGWITPKDEAGMGFFMMTIGNIAAAAITLDQSVPAITDYDTKIHGGNFDANYPMLKINANGEFSGNHMYNILHTSKIKNISLVGIALGLKNLILQNDNGILDPTKPFQPFGPQPVVGSHFYIGCHEAFKKDLYWLNFSVKWHGIPTDSSGNVVTDLKDYYNHNDMTDASIATNYDPENTDFKAKFDILKDYNWTNLLSATSNKEIFNDTNISLLKYFDFNANGSNLSIGDKPELEKFNEYTINSNRGFLRLTLDQPNQAFGHKHYSALYTEQVIENIWSGDITLPVEPYTPQISEISLSYATVETIDISTTTDFDKRTTKFFHITPFGQQEVHKKLTGNDLYLLPQFKHTYKDGVEQTHQGEFYIGLKNLDPPENVSLLFKVAEGSANPELDKQEIDWFYLDDNKWVPFNIDEILSDTTNGLLTTGIIKFSMPRTATNKNSIMDAGYYWIMGTVAENNDAICDIIEVYSQAGTASFKDNKNDPNFLATALPADTIAKLKVKKAEVKSITQPYASFGGKVKESDNEFYRRISERLRHKERGIAIWDYERMILQEFPEIYKAKCISHSTYDYKGENNNLINSEFAPGYVTVIVVPELKNQNAVDPLKPRVSLNTLDNIKTFLNKYNSPFAAEKLKVINPLFERIQVKFYVEFHKGYDRGYYENQLKQDIIEYLSPWAFQEGKDVVFGGKIHRSVILNFIEERVYVDYLTDFEMNHIIDDSNILYNVEEAIATTARSILVSNDTHEILTTSSCS